MKHCRVGILSILAGGANAEAISGQGDLTRIIGGSEAVEDRHSYAVALLGGCTGSLIARDVVLTAAHCMAGSDYMDYAVLGRHDLNDGDGEVLAAREVIPHPLYNLVTAFDNDFMLVFLASASSADIVTVKLNKDPSLPSVGQTLTVMGWGDTEIGTGIITVPDKMMNADVIAISNEECNSSEGYDDTEEYLTYLGTITENMLCVASNGKASCQGDSGGPLVIKGDDDAADVQVGVVSWALGCAIDQFPDV